jgi:hypothetical protein
MCGNHVSPVFSDASTGNNPVTSGNAFLHIQKKFGIKSNNESSKAIVLKKSQMDTNHVGRKRKKKEAKRTIPCGRWFRPVSKDTRLCSVCGKSIHEECVRLTVADKEDFVCLFCY